MEVHRDTHPVKCILTVIAADQKQRLCVQSLAQYLRESFADPSQPRLMGCVIKRKYENGLRPRCFLAISYSWQQREQEQQREMEPILMRVQSLTIITSEPLRRSSPCALETCNR